MRSQLLLVGHGAPEKNANAPMHDAVTRLQARGFDASLALLSEEGSVQAALGSDGPLVVIPLLTSRGYFYERLKTMVDARADAVLTDVVGESDELFGALLSSVRSLCVKHGLSDVVVVGHGTPKRKHSAATTRIVVQKLRDMLPQNVHAAFLEQAPFCADVAETLREQKVLVVPFFMGRGPHVTQDLPKAFGFDEGPDFPKMGRGGIAKVCAPPVGDAPLLAKACAALAERVS